MDDRKRLLNNLAYASLSISTLFFMCLVEAVVIWHQGQKWDTVKLALLSTLIFIWGLISLRRVRKQVLPRSSN
jgi:cytochrome c biogenesis protein CcdA